MNPKEMVEEFNSDLSKAIKQHENMWFIQLTLLHQLPAMFVNNQMFVNNNQEMFTFSSKYVENYLDRQGVSMAKPLP
uniref:Uncharacterized protein n=1 Tax=Arion vulgaris TaxID=1028688 RepID=A0A0B7AF72_9EUPU